MHDNFNEDDVHELLKIENEIIEFIEGKYDKLTTIKNKLCGILKVNNLLNLECTQLKSKIDHYMVTLSLRQRSIQGVCSVDEHQKFKNKCVHFCSSPG